jgi:hypothetical protein
MRKHLFLKREDMLSTARAMVAGAWPKSAAVCATLLLSGTGSRPGRQGQRGRA